MNNSPVLFIFEKKSHYQKNRSHRPGQKIACVKNRIDKPDAQRQATAYLKKGMRNETDKKSIETGFRLTTEIENQTEQIKNNGNWESELENQRNHLNYLN